MKTRLVGIAMVAFLGAACSSSSSSGSAAPPGITPQALLTALVNRPFPTAGLPPGLAPIRVQQSNVSLKNKAAPFGTVLLISDLQDPVESFLSLFVNDSRATYYAKAVSILAGTPTVAVPIGFDGATCREATVIKNPYPLIECRWLDNNVVGACIGSAVTGFVPDCAALLGAMREDLQGADPQGGY